MLNKANREIPMNIPALEGREVYQGEFAVEPKMHRAGRPVAKYNKGGADKLLASIDEAIEKNRPKRRYDCIVPPSFPQW